MPVFWLGNDESYGQFWYESFRKAFKPAVDKLRQRLENADFKGATCVILGFPSDHSEIAEGLQRLRGEYPDLYALLLLPICDCCLAKVKLKEGVDVTDWFPKFSLTQEEDVSTGWADTGYSYRYPVSEDEFVNHVLARIRLNTEQFEGGHNHSVVGMKPWERYSDGCLVPEMVRAKALL